MGVAGSLNLDNLRSAQSIGSPSRNSTARFYPPDLDLNETRGPVKMCIAETEFDGRKSVEITEYGPGGKWLSTRHETDGRLTYDSSSPEWIHDEVRDSQGRLIKSTDGKVGKPLRETEYIYDDDKLLTFIHYGFSRSEYHYAADGSSTSVQTFDPKTIEQNGNAVCDEWESTTIGAGVPVGGSATTTYDRNQNPTELQVRSGEGVLVKHMVRTYDAEGRLTEEKLLEKTMPTSFLTWMSAEQQAEMTPAQLKAYSQGPYALIKKPLGTKYAYDAQGRLTAKRECNVFYETTTRISYNEQGDRARVRTANRSNSIMPMGPSYSFCFDAGGNPIISKSEDRPGLPERNYMAPDTDIRYAYHYDRYGNWTEKTESCDGGIEFVTRCTITYYWPSLPTFPPPFTALQECR